MGEDGEPARKKQKRSKNATLHAIKWRRVVLDEGHLIKNPKAKMTRACLELKAECVLLYRNRGAFQSTDDLREKAPVDSLGDADCQRFRRSCVLTSTLLWSCTDAACLDSRDHGAISARLQAARPARGVEAVCRERLGRRTQQAPARECTLELSRFADSWADLPSLVQAVVSSTTLRRTKDMFDPSGKPLVQLPSVERYMHEIDLKDDVRELYDEIEAEIGKSVKSSLKEQGGKTGYTHIRTSRLLAFTHTRTHSSEVAQSACFSVSARLPAILRLSPATSSKSAILPHLTLFASVLTRSCHSLRDRKLAARIQRDHERAIGLPTSGKGPVSAEQLDFVRSLLREAIEAGADCLACGRWAEDPRITICQHVFCQSWCVLSVHFVRASSPR